MTTDNIDELIDKAIDEALGTPKEMDEELKKRKPKPSFRYITDKQEIKEELSQIKTPITVMKEISSVKIVDDKFAILGLGDLTTIENVLKKHEASKKFKEK